MPRRILVLGVLAAVTLSGCRLFDRSVPLPVRHSVNRGQLIVYRETPLAEDERLLDELEGLRDEIHGALQLPESDVPIRVYLFDDLVPYQRFLQHHFPTLPDRRALFVDTGRQLAVYAYRGDQVAVDLRHEVAHGYLHAAMFEVPLWLDEGLAEYFEVGRAQLGINRSHARLIATLEARGEWSPNLARLEALTGAEQMVQRDYAEAWAWVYWLLQGSPQRRSLLVNYLAQLRAGDSVAPLSFTLRKLHFQPEQTMREHVRLVASEGSVTSDGVTR